MATLDMPHSDPDELTPDDLAVIVGAVELLRDKIRDRPIDPAESAEDHQAAYLAKRERIDQVERILPKVRRLARELKRLGPPGV